MVKEPVEGKPLKSIRGGDFGARHISGKATAGREIDNHETVRNEFATDIRTLLIVRVNLVECLGGWRYRLVEEICRQWNDQLKFVDYIFWLRDL